MQDSSLADLFLNITFEVFCRFSAEYNLFSSRCKCVKEMPKKCFERSQLSYFTNFPWSSVRKVGLAKVIVVKPKGFISIKLNSGYQEKSLIAQ